jgi:hypothetical protein
MRKAAAAVVCGLAWIYTAAHFAMTGVKQPLGNFTGDFLASFPSWRVSVLTGRMDMFHGSLAGWWAMKFSNFRPLWHYGPVEHLVTLPLFAFRDLRTAYIGWLIANYVFLAGILILACDVFRSGRSKWFWRSVVCVAVLNYGPLFEALTQRTIEIFELLLIFAAFALFFRGRAGGSGVTIGFAAMTKFLPLIFLPYFFVKRQARALRASVITIAVIATAAEAVLGWRYSGTVVQLRSGGLIYSETDQSLAGMIRRLVVWTQSPVSVSLLSRIAILLGLAGVAWLFVRARHCAAIEDLEWSTLIAVMVLLPPHNEQYYFVLLLFPYLALLARELRPDVSPHRARRWWLAISFILTGTLVPLSIVGRVTGLNIFPLYLASGIPFIGAAILAAICIHALVAECEAVQVAPGTPHAL